MLTLLAQGGGHLRYVKWACIARRWASRWWILLRALVVQAWLWV